MQEEKTVRLLVLSCNRHFVLDLIQLIKMEETE